MVHANYGPRHSDRSWLVTDPDWGNQTIEECEQSHAELNQCERGGGRLPLDPPWHMLDEVGGR